MIDFIPEEISMTSMNVSLPESMREYVDRQVETGGYSTASEFIRHLIRDDQKRSADQRLQVALLEGLDSGEPIEITDEWWSRKREELAARLNAKRKQKRKTPKASKSNR